MSDPEDWDMLAAEYVLGTLDAAERDAAAAQLGTDDAFARVVRDWEDRLSPLIGAVPDAEPPAGAYAAIASRLFGEPRAPSVSRPHPAVAALRRRVRQWQGATAAFALLAAALLAWIALREASPVSISPHFAAVLQRDAGAPVMLVDVDVAARRLTVRPLAAAAPVGRSYELWIIDPALGAPRSLGVVPPTGEARDSLTSFDAAVITGATYAVTVEAPGGSSTGRPTTAPVLSGKLALFGS